MAGKVSIQIGGGSGLLMTLLTVLFIGLKLTEYINWSWLWVLCPVWIPFAIFIAGLFLVLVVSPLLANKRRW